MKKCASCTKDLPDAALHCVFCGAKQPPAPAVQQGIAKTAFGYSANDVVEQLRQQRGAQGGSGPAATPPPAPVFDRSPAVAPTARPATAPAFTTPRAALVPTGAAIPPYSPPPGPPGVPPYSPPPSAPQRQGASPSGPTYPAGPPAAFVPATAANAATMFAPGQAQPPGSPQMAATMVPPAGVPSYGRPQPPSPQMAATMVAPPSPQPAPARPPSQPLPQPQMPPLMRIPAAQPPPYLAAQTASRLGRPSEPWKDSLRLMMFLWGVGLLAVFATPLATSPRLRFNWTLILDGAGTARLPPLMLAAVGVLSMIVAGIPMQPAARGLLAAVLGLAGIIVPIALVGTPPWQPLFIMVGTLLLVPSLLLRSEYRDALIPRMLITIGALAVLLPYLLPQQSAIPLVGIFKAMIELPGTQKIFAVLAFSQVFVVVMSLLAWLPGPTTGAATLWAWLLILWTLITDVTLLLVGGNLGSALSSKPNETLVSWIAGGATPLGIGLGAAYVALVGYGLASVVGKQLE